jgi:hypothetical protein
MKAEKYFFRLIFFHLTPFLPLSIPPKAGERETGERSLLCEDIWRFIIPLNPPFIKGSYNSPPFVKGE